MMPTEPGNSYKSLLEQLLHELRTITHTIKASSEVLSKGSSGDRLDKPAVEHHSQRIFENAYLLSLWLDIADFELNPEFFSSQELQSRSLWGKFKKASLSFRSIAKNRNIQISANGESFALLDCYPVVDILPYLILDNAIKYSPTYSTVDINFDETANRVNIDVSSMGPISSSTENDRLFEHGFRSKAAESLNIQGQGRGLALAKAICDLHDASITVARGENSVLLNEGEYAEFKLNIVFNR